MNRDPAPYLDEVLVMSHIASSVDCNSHIKPIMNCYYHFQRARLAVKRKSILIYTREYFPIPMQPLILLFVINFLNDNIVNS